MENEAKNPSDEPSLKGGEAHAVAGLVPRELQRLLACPHSMFRSDCLGCWCGHAARLEGQLRKLEESTALPIRERIEKAVREQMEHCYQVYKGVPPTVEDWVGGALHYVMWGIERDLPLAATLDTQTALGGNELADPPGGSLQHNLNS